MNYLSILTPAEILMVLYGKDASVKELLKTTFMDLLLKQVLEIIEVEKQASIRESVRIYDYVKTGKNFLNYSPFPHEIVFLSPFQKTKNIQILFQTFVKLGYQNTESQYSYQLLLTRNQNIKDYFNQTIFQKIYGGFRITQTGLEIRNKLQSELEVLENELPDFIINNPQKALEILNVIKGNIFLLKNIDFDLLKQFDNQILNEMSRYNNTDTDPVLIGWSTFLLLDNFDSSYSGESDNGGDSGCSGCSGCGGD